MDPSNVAFVKGVITFLLLAGTGMGAYWMTMRMRRLPPSTDAKTIDELREENQQLRAEVETRVAELEERVAFAEQLFTKTRAPQALPSSESAKPE